MGYAMKKHSPIKHSCCT